MSNRNIKNISASVRAKLLNKARKDNRPFTELLQYFAMERFLYRLSTSQHSEKFILKGALMFTAWEFSRHRATMDIDMLAKTSNSVDNLIAITQEICIFQPEIEDGLIFDAKSVSGKVSQTNKEYSGVQLKFNAQLATARIQMKVDVGFGDIVSPSPSLITYPTILQLPSPKLRGYTAETVIAEKFHSIVSRGIDNSRMKDFYDLWTLQKQMTFEGTILLEAIIKTFSNRQTKLGMNSITELILFGENEEKNRQWQQFLRKNQFDSKTPKLKVIIEDITIFLSPLIKTINKGISPPSIWSIKHGWSSRPSRK